ncbi:MAG: endopeptidase La [Bacillota bacterium]|jgi:ATP-dependent Lon protease|nr:endopeptidase La [Bacillota bacterium]NLJ03737.1 endopeptidase La [Bacillota bacterium]
MVQPTTSNSLPLLPLRGTLVFPYMVTPLEVGRARSIEAVEQSMLRDGRIVLAAQHQLAVENPQPEDIHGVGTLCEIKQLLRVPEGQIRVLVEGLSRVTLDHIEDADGYYEAFVTVVPETDGEMDNYELEALMRVARDEFEKYVRLSKKIPAEVLMTVSSIEDPHRFADTIASQLNVAFQEKQKLLEIFPVDKRLEGILGVLYREGEILGLERTIQQRVRKQMEKAQREYYLREQIKAIQVELGERDEKGNTEAEELREKLEKAKLPKEAKAKVLHEIHRLERMAPMAAEATVVRNYIDWMLSLPWSKRTKDRLDLNLAEELLDQDHYGLEKVKERILEFLAVRQLTKSTKGPILCLVGPPGVGKTSLAQSVGKALNRNFARLSLGGVRDEAEIRGHRRTYIGSMPGRIIQTMKNVNSLNPVIVLDEIDKLASDFRGDPASALLEVLDPEQNHRFGDHYLEVPFDLSEVLFVTTANVLHSIPAPLRDRMEVIEIPGYTEYEKFEIAKRHLWPKQLKNNGLKEDQIQISDNTIYKVINEYTREAGVRNLERRLSTICRKVATEIVKGQIQSARVNVSNLHRYLGVPRYQQSQVNEEDRVGVATGLAFTQVGGETLTIEVTVVDGKGKLTLTGQLGDVMQESAQAALSYLRSRANELGIDPKFHESCDIHMHIPEGAIPKDGPSAGITIATALASALTNRPVRHDLSMTGEITLRGRILPIGGVKEKLLAAHRAGITHVLLPTDNEKDLEEIPASVLGKMQITLVEHMDEVLSHALYAEPVNDQPLPFMVPPMDQPVSDESWMGEQ